MSNGVYNSRPNMRKLGEYPVALCTADRYAETNSTHVKRPSRVHRQLNWLHDYILETPV
jgi:hypothetical protein